MVKQMDIPEGTEYLWKTHAGAEEKCEEEEVAERNCYVRTIAPPPPCATCGGRGVWSKGVKSGLGQGEERCCFNVFLSISHYLN